jgi:hypothetical protein
VELFLPFLLFVPNRAGAGGRPLVQTFLETTNLTVLLIERGRERPKASRNILAADQVLRDECAETFFSRQGVVVAAGNCM